MTFAGKPVQQPKWDQMFFYYGDDRWLFTSTSALVIEYFNALQGMDIFILIFNFLSAKNLRLP